MIVFSTIELIHETDSNETRVKRSDFYYFLVYVGLLPYLTPIRRPILFCDCPDVIYYIFYTKYNNGVYVRETGIHFHLRFNNHKQAIREKSPQSPVAKHFNLPRHTLNNIKCVWSRYTVLFRTRK